MANRRYYLCLQKLSCLKALKKKTNHNTNHTKYVKQNLNESKNNSERQTLQLLRAQVTTELQLFNIFFEKQRRNTEAFNITCKYVLIHCGLEKENLT